MIEDLGDKNCIFKDKISDQTFQNYKFFFKINYIYKKSVEYKGIRVKPLLALHYSSIYTILFFRQFESCNFFMKYK
jgi:hypothetical protein